jgi:hypothetical protein
VALKLLDVGAKIFNGDIMILRPKHSFLAIWVTRLTALELIRNADGLFT